MDKKEVFELTYEYSKKCKAEETVLTTGNVNKFLSWLQVDYDIKYNNYTYFYQDVSYTVRKKTFRGFKLTIGGVNCGVFLQGSGTVKNTVKGQFYPAVDVTYDTRIKDWCYFEKYNARLNTLGIVAQVKGVKEWSDNVISDTILDRNNISVDKLFKMV